VSTTASGEQVERLVEKVAAIAPLVRAQAAEAEHNSRPTDMLVDALHEAGLFNLTLPPESGGAGISSWEIAPIIEALARVDGSAGWTMALGQSLLLSRLPPQAAQKLQSEDRLLLAGSLNPLQGRVKRIEGGYHFHGTGTYVSNGTHATHIMLAGLVVDDDGRPNHDSHRPRDPRWHPSALGGEILDTWAMAGMRGTGSHDVKFDGVVNEDLTMPLGDALANLGVTSHRWRSASRNMRS